MKDCKKGFISISVVYTFLLLFIFSFFASCAHTRIISKVYIRKKACKGTKIFTNYKIYAVQFAIFARICKKNPKKRGKSPITVPLQRGW